ncbi:maf-like protein domain-containing protein [Ditylenchus destructor]|uniref:Maf-like protein domain-containing protein n=1 Tax=Ditylenchus destructor TaxID=166010 RepID=A0AAD4MTA2_9BILA|nr:maf-like protein domain-containing protein [Ditylenchus destructor]
MRSNWLFVGAEEGEGAWDRKKDHNIDDMEDEESGSESRKKRQRSYSLSKFDRLPIIVLASGSSNRLKLLQKVGINPIVEPSDFPENLSKHLPPGEFAQETALRKAQEVVTRFQEGGTTFDVVIGCDTIIYFDGLILGKPRDEDDAFDTLKRLNGQKHSVYTGVALISAKEKVEKFFEETIVEFGDIPEEILRAYVDTGEPMGRAGSYGIQGKAGVFVKSIAGCFNNVVGLPIYEVVKRLRTILRK